MSDPQSNDPRELLSHLVVPAAADDVKSRALASALAALNDGSVRPASTAWKMIAVGGALAAFVLACVLLPAKKPSDDPAMMLSEMEKLFSGQLDSVILEGQNVAVNTAGVAAPTPEDQRICITISKSHGDVRVLTYSGRRVCLRLDGSEVCFTPLMKGDGTVFIVTDTQVIQNGAAALPSGDRFEMRRMQEVRS